MGRTIKFRGKRVDNGDWAYGSLYEHKTPNHQAFILMQDSATRERWSNGHKSGWCANGSRLAVDGAFEVHPEAVGQFTGLLDKNGVEIYENDLVHEIFKGSYRVNKKGDKIVSWVKDDDCNPCFVLKRANGENCCDVEYDFVQYNLMELEVCGTIHDESEGDHE